MWWQKTTKTMFNIKTNETAKPTMAATVTMNYRKRSFASQQIAQLKPQFKRFVGSKRCFHLVTCGVLKKPQSRHKKHSFIHMPLQSYVQRRSHSLNLSHRRVEDKMYRIVLAFSLSYSNVSYAVTYIYFVICPNT